MRICLYMSYKSAYLCRRNVSRRKKADGYVPFITPRSERYVT